MTPAVTPAQRLEEAGRWLAAAGGHAKPGEIGAALSLNHARQSDVVRALREQGLVEGDRLRVQLTSAGWTRFAGTGIDHVEGVLGRVLQDWPSRYRSLVELAVGAVIARHHLGAARPSGHLALVALGPSATGKSTLGQVVCHLFGWEPEEHEIHVPEATEGDLLGRLENSTAGWIWTPSAATRLPFVVLDEVDKAKDDVKRRAQTFLQGKRRVRVGDHLHELLPTPLVTMNPPKSGDRYRDLHEAYRRRSVVLDTEEMKGRGREVGRLMRALLEHGDPADRLHLDALVPPARLDESGIAALESVEQLLTEEGRAEYDLPGLELATLGRCALLGPDVDHVVAAMSTGIAYLHVTESRPGQVRPDWMRLAQALREEVSDQAGYPDVQDLLGALDRAECTQQAALETATEGRRRQARVELGVLEAGEVLASRCRRLRMDLDGRSRKVLLEQRDQAAGLRKILGRHATTAAQVTTEASLREVQQAAADAVERAEALLAAVATERTEAEREAKQAKDDAARDRKAKAQAEQVTRLNAAAQRHARQEQLRQVVAEAERLEALYERSTTRAGESPWAVLVRLRVGDGQVPLLTYVDPPPEPAARGLARLVRKIPQGTWHVTASSLTFTGSRCGCADLAAWGPSTQAVIAPTLGALYAVEDQLRAQVHARPRKRPRIGASGGVVPVAAAPHARALPPGTTPTRRPAGR